MKNGSVLGIIGESGSGKTSIALSIMKLLPKYAKITGEIDYNNRVISNLTDKEFNKYKWNKIAMVFQNSIDALNPVLTVHEQIFECIKRKNGIQIVFQDPISATNEYFTVDK